MFRRETVAERNARLERELGVRISKGTPGRSASDPVAAEMVHRMWSRFKERQPPGYADKLLYPKFFREHREDMSALGLRINSKPRLLAVLNKGRRQILIQGAQRRAFKLINGL